MEGFILLSARLATALASWSRTSRAGKPSFIRPSEARPEAAPQPSIYDSTLLRWSGQGAKRLALKTLTYRQFDCLDDARHGYAILAEQHSGVESATSDGGERVKFHSPRTVTSLEKHGFLAESVSGTYVITEHGLQAVEECTVRY